MFGVSRHIGLDSLSSFSQLGFGRSADRLTFFPCAYIQGATSTLFSVISGPFLFSVVFFVGLFVLF